MPNFFPANGVDDCDIFPRVSEHEWYGLWNVEESFSSHPAIMSMYIIKEISTGLL